MNNNNVAERYIAHRTQRHEMRHQSAIVEYMDRFAPQLGGEVATANYYAHFRQRVEEDQARFDRELAEIESDSDYRGFEKRERAQKLTPAESPAWSQRDEDAFVENWGDPRHDAAIVSLISNLMANHWVEVTIGGMRQKAKTPWELTLYNALIYPQDGSIAALPLTPNGYPDLNLETMLEPVFGSYRPTQPPVPVPAQQGIRVGQDGSIDSQNQVAFHAPGELEPPAEDDNPVPAVQQEAPPLPQQQAPVPQPPQQEASLPQGPGQVIQTGQGQQIVIPTLLEIHERDGLMTELVANAEDGDFTLKMIAVANGVSAEGEPREIAGRLTAMADVPKPPLGEAPAELWDEAPAEQQVPLKTGQQVILSANDEHRVAQQKALDKLCPHCFTSFERLHQHEPNCAGKHGVESTLKAAATA